MKFTFRVIFWVFSFMGMMVLYVHGQIGIFKISYLIDAKMEALTAKGEEYRQLKFEVDQMKAPRLLEEKMKTMKLDLSLPQEVRIVSYPEPRPMNPPVMHSISQRSLAEGILDFFGRWVKVAQAKMEN